MERVGARGGVAFGGLMSAVLGTLQLRPAGPDTTTVEVTSTASSR